MTLIQTNSLYTCIIFRPPIETFGRTKTDEARALYTFPLDCSQLISKTPRLFLVNALDTARKPLLLRHDRLLDLIFNVEFLLRREQTMRGVNQARRCMSAKGRPTHLRTYSPGSFALLKAPPLADSFFSYEVREMIRC